MRLRCLLCDLIWFIFESCPYYAFTCNKVKFMKLCFTCVRPAISWWPCLPRRFYLHVMLGWIGFYQATVLVLYSTTTAKGERCTGGIFSDWLGNRVGMVGRLWWLFFCQMGGAVLCIILGIGPVQRSLSYSIGVMIVFSAFIEVTTLSLVPNSQSRKLYSHQV